MLTTGLWITPLCNEDKYALAFISRPPSPFNLLPSTPRVFFYPFRQLVIFFPPLPCVFMLLSVYTCTCVTQIAVDGFNQMAAPFCCFSVVSLPVYGSLPFGVLRRAQLRKKQRGAAASALCQKCRDKKRKKEKKKAWEAPPHTKEDSDRACVRPDAVLWLTYQPLCCLVRYFFMYCI